MVTLHTLAIFEDIYYTKKRGENSTYEPYSSKPPPPTSGPFGDGVYGGLDVAMISSILRIIEADSLADLMTCS